MCTSAITCACMYMYNGQLLISSDGQPCVRGKRGSTLSSNFCTVQVLVGLKNLCTLRNTGVSTIQEFNCTQTYINAFGTKQTIHNIVEGGCP